MTSPSSSPERDARIFALSRPHPNLLKQYVISAFFTTFAFPIIALVLYFRYHTLRYRFDDKGVSISYGILFRREAFVTYARIQDIHVKRNIIERWLDLGTVEIETAAGGSGGSEAIVGLTEYEEVRDFLYSKMRGASAPAALTAGAQGASTEELLREIRDALRDVRRAIGGAP